MRALLSKVLTGSMIAGAALAVAACGGGGSAENNMAATDTGTEALDTTNDVTAIDAGTASDMNMANDTGAAAETTNATGNTSNGM